MMGLQVEVQVQDKLEGREGGDKLVLSWGRKVVCGQLMLLTQMAGRLKIGCVSGCS